MANLVAAGFPSTDIMVVGGVVYTGRDAVVTLQASRELLQADATSTEEQYRTTNLVGANVRNICVNGAAFAGDFSTALDRAIRNYNNPALRWRMTRTSGAGVGCDATITANLIGGNGGVAGFPSNGLPYFEINIGTGLSAYGVNTMTHVITHELGHCLGFRHTDYYNRTISCGQGGNEGEADVGAIHIPGTPVDAVLNGSVMNACFNGSESGNFLANDITALNALYGPQLSWTASSVWSNFYSNAAGYSASPSYWRTIEFPDLNNDKQRDVCGRNALGIQCGTSNGSAFSLPIPWGVTFTDLLGWATNENNWGTIAYPDVNGDGRADVCARGSGGIQCALSTGLIFGIPTMWSTGFTDAGGWGAGKNYWGTIAYPDVNGDGRADICARGAGGIVCGLSSGTAFGAINAWNASFNDAGGWGASESYWGTIRYADVNGDGRADVCGRGAGGVVCGLSTGTSFAGPGTWSSFYSDANNWGSTKAYWGTIRFPDLDGDGKKDICARGTSGISCALSNGTSFGAVTLWNTEFSDGFGYNVSESYWGTIDFPDVSGDGRADVCGRRGDGIICGLSNGAQFVLNTIRTGAFPDGAGWYANENQWRTIRYPDLNNDGKAEVCGRSADGILCAK